MLSEFLIVPGGRGGGEGVKILFLFFFFFLSFFLSMGFVNI